MASSMYLRIRTLLLAAAFAAAAHASPAPFDLAGPVLKVKVIRGAMSLPISQVPNLAAGDRIWISADLPPNQSSHYLMVAAFLSGSTNPPPVTWFFPCKTWTGQCARDGLTVTVPQGAQQVLVFLAPETGGDFRTLVGAVRGSPGTFVRTSQDLNQAALDRSRLQRYLSAIGALNDSDPSKLKAATPMLARSLAIKVDDKCLGPAARAASAMSHAGPGVSHSQRWAQHIDRRGAHLGSRQRFGDGGKLYTATQLRVLQSVYRIRSGYCTPIWTRFTSPSISTFPRLDRCKEIISD